MFTLASAFSAVQFPDSMSSSCILFSLAFIFSFLLPTNSSNIVYLTADLAELDTLVIGNCFLKKKDQDPTLEKDYKSSFELD